MLPVSFKRHTRGEVRAPRGRIDKNSLAGQNAESLRKDGSRTARLCGKRLQCPPPFRCSVHAREGTRIQPTGFRQIERKPRAYRYRSAPPFFLPETLRPKWCGGRENGAPELVESLWWTRITPIGRPIFEPMRRIAAPALNIRCNLYLGSELRLHEGAPHGLFITHMARLNRDRPAFAKG
jgi:hypothetical protein